MSIYRLVRSAYEPHLPADKSFLRKTAEVVQKHTRTGGIFMPEEIHEIDVEMLERLAGEERSETVRVFNLITAFYHLVQQGRHQAPYLVSIGQRAEEIARAFEERQLTAQEALRQLKELVEQYKRRGMEQALELAKAILQHRPMACRYGLHAVSGPVGGRKTRTLSSPQKAEQG